MTLDSLRAHIRQLLAQMDVEMLVHGNYTKSEALDVAKLVSESLLPFAVTLCALCLLGGSARCWLVCAYCWRAVA